MSSDVGPRSIKTDVVGQATRIKGSLALRYRKLGQIAGKMLCRRGRTAVSQCEYTPTPLVAIQQQVSRVGNRLAIQFA